MEEKVLIVEDESKIADSLKLGLTESNFNADVAYDGTAGYKLFKSKQYDIILLDINLPGMNGYELCKYFRASDPQVPIIMLTSLIELEDKVKAYDIGADDYIVKPFEFREVLLKMKALLRRTSTAQTPSASLLQAADLEMNLDSKQVRRGDRPINLTAKEFQLLEYLLLNKNKVVSRGDIAINVWDVDFDTNTNVIDVYINYLRNKVDRPFKNKLIQTQVGMGYILKDKEN
jgi:two-component system, OmpR family, copper resistance phosphate regulon response regulator CusR